MQPKVVYRTITPEEAHLILKYSKRKNVPTKKSKIDQYARAMIAGKWDEHNSQAISLDTDSNIVNGHQRLMACVQANTPFRTLFITGVPPETFSNEDTGRSRDAGHFFAVLGEKNYVALAAGARALLLWERGLWKYAGTSGNSGVVPITYDELQEEVERRPALRKAADFYSAATHMKGRFPAGMIVALHTLTSTHSKHKAFWDELSDRMSTDKASPAWQLNRRIDLVKAKSATITKQSLLALLTKSWNIYVQDEWVNLTMDRGRGEKVPTPVSFMVPALLPPDSDKNEVITTTPKTKRIKPLEGPPQLKVIPKPERKTKSKKTEPKLRGGLGS